MGNFNEIQKGMPDLGKTYWQDLKNKNKEENPVSEIVEMNCQTIFEAENSLINKKQNPSIFS